MIERDDEDDPVKQYVWGSYIDELLPMKMLVTINGNATGNYYPLSDLMYRTVALTNHAGAVIEAYDCDVYGNTLIFTAPGTASDWWADNATQGAYPTCEAIFTGRQFDPETKLYQFRYRYYDPITGRFIGGDPIGYRDGMGLYTAWFVSRGMDPTGLQSVIPINPGGPGRGCASCHPAQPWVPPKPDKAQERLDYLYCIIQSACDIIDEYSKDPSLSSHGPSRFLKSMLCSALSGKRVARLFQKVVSQ